MKESLKLYRTLIIYQQYKENYTLTERKRIITKLKKNLYRKRAISELQKDIKIY